MRNLLTRDPIMELFESGQDVKARIDDLDNQSWETLRLVNDGLWQFSHVRNLMQPRDPSFRV